MQRHSEAAATVRSDLVSRASASRASVIVGPHGEPLRASTPHYGADTLAPELRSWTPALTSADSEILPDWDTMVARTRDMIRNHGLTSGAVQIHLDNIIGAGLRLSAKPDWRALNQDPDWADAWARDVEGKFRQWANDIDCYCDAGQRLNFSGMLMQQYRSFLSTGDMCASAEWLPGRGSRYSTCLQMVEPERLSTPGGQADSQSLRGGIELDSFGAPLAYHIRQAHPNDYWSNQGAFIWKRIPRRTSWGRLQFVHVFEAERAGQTRGKSTFVSVLAKLKMLEKFEQVTLQAAILNAMYAATIESPMDWQQVGGAMGTGEDPLMQYMGNRADWHAEGNVRYGGLKIPHLFPGEKLNLTTPQHPKAEFSQFEEATLRYIAGGLNLSYEQMSRDYSKSNYSSARAAMLESFRFFFSRRHQTAGKFATLVYALWLEEAISIGDVVIPDNAPSFYQAKTAWTGCKWIGPGRGHIDPDKESKAIERNLKIGTTTYEATCAENGDDWEEVMEQKARERKRMLELGLDPDSMLGIGVKPGPTPAEPEERETRDD
jgi:lambda family phage portal protein